MQVHPPRSQQVVPSTIRPKPCSEPIRRTIGQMAKFRRPSVLDIEPRSIRQHGQADLGVLPNVHRAPVRRHEVVGRIPGKPDGPAFPASTQFTAAARTANAGIAAPLVDQGSAWAIHSLCGHARTSVTARRTVGNTSLRNHGFSPSQMPLRHDGWGRGITAGP